MDNIFFEHGEDTPEVNLNYMDGKCSISGRSLPENAVAFYSPIFEWLDNFAKSDQTALTFDFKLDYFNTASAKQITKLLLAMQTLSNTKTVHVRWHYFTEDVDIKSSGMRFARLIKLNIELVEYSD